MVALFAALLSLSLQIVPQPPGTISLNSQSTDGQLSNGISVNSSISDDGRYVGFESVATNLVTGDTNNASDVFVRDRVLHTTRRLSLTSTGAQVPQGALWAALSGDGTKIGFMSNGVFVAGDTNGKFDIFEKDISSGTVRIVSLGKNDVPADGDAAQEELSYDGRYVVFVSYATNLVDGDTNGASDVFVRDMQTAAIERVSVASDGSQGNGPSLHANITPDGRYVVFASFASNFAAGDTNAQADIFVRDRLLGTTRIMSCTQGGIVGDNDSGFPSISSDGRWVAFHSRAGNLVPGDVDAFSDVFLKDSLTGAIEMISVTIDGTVQEGPSDSPDVSADGRFVAFGSQADNLIPYLPHPHHTDHEIFLRDRLLGKTQQISLTPAHQQADLGSINPQMTPDASVIAFETYATNLIAGLADTNNCTDTVAADMHPWTKLQGGLIGNAGVVPQLSGDGLLVAAGDDDLVLQSAAPGAPALLLVALQSVPVPFKGGTLLAYPYAALVAFGVDAGGGALLPFTWPTGVPSATTIFFQVLIQDPSAAKGVAISTGLAAITP